MRSGCGFLIEKDRKIIAFAYLCTYFFGKGDSFFHRHIFDGDERNYIYGTHTGMLPGMVVKIDKFYSNTDSFENGITKGTSSTTFSPNASVTRAQVATMLHRYLTK